MIIVIVLLLIVAVCFRSKINEIVSFDKRVSDYKISFKVSSISDSSYDYFLMEDSIWRNVYLDSPELLLGSIVKGGHVAQVHADDRGSDLLAAVVHNYHIRIHDHLAVGAVPGRQIQFPHTAQGAVVIQGQDGLSGLVPVVEVID